MCRVRTKPKWPAGPRQTGSPFPIEAQKVGGNSRSPNDSQKVGRVQLENPTRPACMSGRALHRTGCLSHVVLPHSSPLVSTFFQKDAWRPSIRPPWVLSRDSILNVEFEVDRWEPRASVLRPTRGKPSVSSTYGLARHYRTVMRRRVLSSVLFGTLLDSTSAASLPPDR
jgi:hypothetical protein